ncbi:MAG: lysylphosphatidylglycerol synthase transmembrane domain-containing protein, partial [Acidobacteriota bacterium]|nr:lysylphosphatidylglycerol synthase transmembrane domain-containing protein [Acidobacteriota bacterium]
MPKKNIFYILLSFIVSVILIWFLLSQIEIKDLFKIFSNIYYPAFLAFIVIALTSALLRAWRYKWLLHPSSISWGNIFLVTFVRNLFVDLFPARIGSLSYIYILNRRLNFSFEAATSTFVVSFVFDFLTLSPFLIFSIFFVGLGNTALSSISLLVISTIFFFLVFIILWKITQLSVFMLKIYRLFLKSIRLKEKKWAKVSTEKIRLTIEDIKQIKKRKIYWPIFFLSLGLRLAKYGSLYLLLFSLLKSHDFSLKTLSFCKTILGT